MKPLNYCRQIAILSKAIAQIPNLDEKERSESLHTMDLCAASQKFLLPFNGKLLDDTEFRALDDSIPLRLPHPFIALEFRGELFGENNKGIEARRVVFCREDDDDIFIYPFAWLPKNGTWGTKTTLRLPKVGYLDRSNPKDVQFFAALVGNRQSGGSPASGDVTVLLGLCNALACSNVKTELIHPKHSSKKIKTALPFDAYHILTIDTGRNGSSQVTGCGGDHRSPREHLRRGHIRRLESGRNVWVNATVVAANKGAGVVKKDYRVK